MKKIISYNTIKKQNLKSKEKPQKHFTNLESIEHNENDIDMVPHIDIGDYLSILSFSWWKRETLHNS